MADIGCIVEWSWYLGKSDELTRMSGLIVSSKLRKTDREKVRVFDVLLADGALVDLREDVPGLEVISESRRFDF